MSGPLAGIRVVDLTVNVLGPIATQILGDMGADVIKVEAAQGDPMRVLGPAHHPNMAAFFLNMNRNKRSLVLDLKQPGPREALLRLVETADVFVHNMRLGAAERLGLGSAAVMARNPRIIYAAAAGFRKGSSWADRPAYDDMIQGESGLADLILRASGEARYAPMAIADKLGGHVLASAIGMALFNRTRTGTGEEINVPMFETLLSFNLVDHLWTRAYGEGGSFGYPRALSRQRRPYPTTDGHICLLATTDEQWTRLFANFDVPELIRDPRFNSLANRTTNIDALYTVLAGLFIRHSTAECSRRLLAADIAHGPMKRLEDLPDDPYVKETGFFQQIDHPTEGRLTTTAIPVTFTNAPGTIRSGAPNLGEHTETLLRELGYTDDGIAEITGQHGARGSG